MKKYYITTRDGKRWATVGDENISAYVGRIAGLEAHDWLEVDGPASPSVEGNTFKSYIRAEAIVSIEPDFEGPNR